MAGAAQAAHANCQERKVAVALAARASSLD
jgi:hypothetical protein